MPKAKVKRKGAIVPLFENPSKKPRPGQSPVGEKDTNESSAAAGSTPTTDKLVSVTRDTHVTSADPCRRSLLDLPEEVICLILARLDIASIASLEASCKHLQKVLRDARVWRKMFLHKLEFEPGLRRFLPPNCLQELEKDAEMDNLRLGEEVTVIT